MPPALLSRVFAEAERLQGRDLKRSLRLITLAWAFGAVFFSATGGTSLPELAKLLGATPFFYGLLGAVPFAATAIQLPVCWIVERTRRRKWLFITCVSGQRILWLVIALLPFVIPRTPEWRTVRLGALLVVYFLAACLGWVGNPTWMGWMADLIPPRIRGRYWAFRRRVGLLISAPTALASGWFIDYSARTGLGVDRGLAIVFTVAAICGTIDVLLFTFIPEIPKRPLQEKLTWRLLLATPLKDQAFRRYLYFSVTLTFATVGLVGHFLQRNLREVVLLDNTMVNATLLIAPSIGSYLAVGWWGRAADRWGNRPIITIATLGSAPLPALWCVVTPELKWLAPLITFLGGVFWSGLELALTNTLLGFAEGNRVSSYQAVSSIMTAVGGVAGPLLAGTLMQLLSGWHYELGPIRLVSYHVLFLISAAMRLLAVVLSRQIIEPKAKRAHDILRIMAANIYNATRSLVLAPLRVVGWPPRATVPVQPGEEEENRSDAAPLGRTGKSG